ncbi:MAG: trypsin-like serine protease [Actinobacteria bacterium]|nr:trypsin-like serine protease [Actinomycetota bacterium]
MSKARHQGPAFLAAAALALSALAATLTGTAQAATVTTTPGVASAAISPAAEAATLAYWTPARMASATSLGSDVPAVSAHSFGGLRSVGALFFTTGSKAHFCTASIIVSHPRNVLLTAAHCVYHGGFVKNLAFVPDYHAGKRPYGTYAVQIAYVTQAWMQHSDISQDFAFLGVNGAVQSKVGAGLRLGINQPTSQQLVVAGYNNGASNPIWCQTRSFQPRGLSSQEEFQCDGFWLGTSGSPWIEGTSLNADGTVFGDIGGYQQGGNSPDFSFSSKFTVSTEILYNIATT